MKTNIAPLDDDAILGKVATLPISSWSYTSEHGVRHVGPMAQDFYAAFNVGEDDKHIASIDEDGVALAAIKAMNARIRLLNAENAALRHQLAALRTADTLHSAHDRRVPHLQGSGCACRGGCSVTVWLNPSAHRASMPWLPATFPEVPFCACAADRRRRGAPQASLR